ncbi:hypothetical protein GCM10010343_48160 [Streptomyces avidinii]|nr:hypothetical protein GCM10010343_48160 [Streptomyces avidinii]
MAFRSEGEQRVVREGEGADVGALGIERVERPGRQLVQFEALDGGGVVQPGAGPDHVRVPRVEVAAGHHAGGAEAGGEPDDGSDVAEVAGVVEDDDGRRPGQPPQPRDAGRPVGPHREGRDAGGVHTGQHLLEVGPPREVPHGALDIRSQLTGQRPYGGGILGDDHPHIGPEPQRVLQRMEPVEHDETSGLLGLPPLPHRLVHTPTLRSARAPP